MNRTFSVAAVILLAFGNANSQVASHAPTNSKQAPHGQMGAAGSSSVVPLQASGKPVVRVNGVELTDVDLVREEYAIFPYAKQHNGIPKDLAPQIREGALQMIVFEELVYQEALRRHMAVAPARMQRARADFRKQFSTPDEYGSFLKTDFQDSQKLLDDKIRRSLLIEALLKSEVDNKSAVTPAEIQAYYNKNADQFKKPELYTFQTISMLPPPNATPEQVKENRARAEKALKQAKAAKTAMDFGLLAEKLSDDDYRVVLGQHKPIPPSQLAPQVLKALQAMKPGDVSDIIQLEQAYTIVKLNEHTPAGKTPLTAVRANLAKDLHERKKEQLRKDLDTQLRKAAKVERI
ncbi:peptidylprolyl isomerase [Occallatibacter riparius]|uniref:peptidylprolyl isomerase n=1 Tax=Occallatibacter riparius TaxID=1002689 RepID=A0A9J7BRZ0_9BACT|nr:peptidylprolyl isomerase [Occallatibacter riparius]UWZ85432.1 peptidyl-prolyl cis-trans isomerase [Occallatibacter riparius]